MRKLKDLMEAWPISQVKKFQRVVEIRAACCVAFVVAVVTGLITFWRVSSILVQ